MKRVLYVDDDESMLLIVGAALRRGAGAAVVTATSAAEVDAALDDGPFDLLLLDYELPGEPGPTLCRRLRQDPRCRSTPVVFLSGHGDEEAGAALAAGASAFLKKPLPPRALLEALSPWLSAGGQEATP